MPIPLHAPARSGSGPWLRCDPRARLLATLAASAVVLAASSWGQICCGLAAVAALHLASGTGPGAALGSLRPFRFLLLFTLLVQAGFTGGAPLLPGLLPGAITIEGSQAAALALLRLAGVIAASAHLVRTTSPLELARSLGWALTPTARVGVPVREVTLVMALGFHFFPVLLDESRQVRAALESRGISMRHPRLQAARPRPALLDARGALRHGRSLDAAGGGAGGAGFRPAPPTRPPLPRLAGGEHGAGCREPHGVGAGDDPEDLTTADLPVFSACGAGRSQGSRCKAGES